MSTDPLLEVEFLPLEAEFISPSSSMREACEGGISDFQDLVKKGVQILPGTSLCLSDSLLGGTISEFCYPEVFQETP